MTNIIYVDKIDFLRYFFYRKIQVVSLFPFFFSYYNNNIGYLFL